MKFQKMLLPDSIIVMSGYSDVVVMRHPQPGAVTVSLTLTFV